MSLKIGNTPLVELESIEEKYNLKARIFAKLECYNPAGSVKDRIAFAMIEDAFERGIINKDSVIIEPTSGNTGIGLAFVGREKGLKVMIVMPETMSIERRQMIQSYGAELVLTEGSKGMKGAIEKANELVKEIPNSFIPSQFTNKVNPKTHYLTTGPEIFSQTRGDVDIFVAGVGTGGTISGVGMFLKEKKGDVKVIAVEPESSPVLSKGVAGAHKIQGIGAGFIPDTLNTSIIDEVITVSNDEAFEKGKELRLVEDLSMGISSGAALAAAIKVAQRKSSEGKTIVVVFPDGGDRYFSTPLFK
jgi:cysteine synthase A